MRRVKRRVKRREKNMVFEKLCELIAEQFGVEIEELTMDTSLEDDLGADSLDLVELSMAVEEEFDTGEITEARAAGVRTIGDIVRLLGDAED